MNLHPIPFHLGSYEFGSVNQRRIIHGAGLFPGISGLIKEQEKSSQNGPEMGMPSSSFRVTSKIWDLCAEFLRLLNLRNKLVFGSQARPSKPERKEGGKERGLRVQERRSLGQRSHKNRTETVDSHYGWNISHNFIMQIDK